MDWASRIAKGVVGHRFVDCTFEVGMEHSVVTSSVVDWVDKMLAVEHCCPNYSRIAR